MVKQLVMAVPRGELVWCLVCDSDVQYCSHVDLPFEYYSTCIDGRLACYEIQCSFADCLNSYIPEGACCPVCPPTEIEGR